MTEEELIENVIIWYRNNVPMMTSKSAKELTKEYLSINSTRRSERRADGSNKQAKELCPKCQSDKLHKGKNATWCKTCNFMFVGHNG